MRAGKIKGSGERGRRVLENRSAKKWRWNPARVQLWHRRERGTGLFDIVQPSRGGMKIITSSNKCDRTAVIGAALAGMDPLMQTRRDTQCDRPEKCAGC